MREITIHTEKDWFVPGDEVTGHVEVSTDSNFTCNKIIMKVRGKEYTHYQAGKVHVSDSRELLHEDIIICEGGDIYSDDTRFDFEFNLPKESPPTHLGFHGAITYTIEAVVEIDRALDPKSKIEFTVKPRQRPYIPEQIPEPAPIRKQVEHLQVEIPTDILRPNKGLQVRFLVKERSRIKGVRLDILRREDIVCKGNKLNSKVVISEKHIPLSFNEFDQWIEKTILLNWTSMNPFESKLIKTSLVLKVVMEVGLAIDPFVEFPLQLSGEEKSKDDLFDSSNLDFEW
jgi:hypothetical protein